MNPKIFSQLWTCLLGLLLSGGFLFGTTYHVGPGQPYVKLQDVTGWLNPGDLVLVDGDAMYPGDVKFTRPGSASSRIVIRGVRINGKRPVISGGVNTVHFNTDSPYSGPGADHYTLEGFEIMGGSFRGIYHQADDLIIRDCVVHDCPAHGVLGADQGSGSLLMEYCEVYGCGSGDTKHQLYIATDEVHYPGSVFRLQYCYIHDGTGGNNVKSRAERNEIFYNWLQNAYYHELELIGPDGGDGGNPALKREDSDVVGNVLWNDHFSITRIGGDGTGESNGRYRFLNNTIIPASNAVFRCFDGLESVEMHNNVIYRPGGANMIRTVEAVWASGSEVIGGGNNWVSQGSTNVPSQWVNTKTGADPQFENFGGCLLKPKTGSPLINAGANSVSSPAGFPFPSPLFPPARHPPEKILPAPGTAQTRPTDGQLDIGAFEFSANGLVKKDFFGSFSGLGVWQRNSTTGAWSQLVSDPAVNLALGDLDGNAGDELIGTFGSGLWICSDSGLWQKIPGVANPQWLAAGDLDGDKKDDLIGVWQGLGVWLRHSGSLAWTRLHDQDALMIAAGDFNQDGQDELLGAWNPEGIWIRNSDGDWSYVLAKTDLLYLTAGDMTGDGQADLLGSWSHGVWYYDFAANSWTRMLAAAEKIAAGDLDGDGRDDLVGTWPGVNGVWVRYSASQIWERLNDLKPDAFAVGKRK